MENYISFENVLMLLILAGIFWIAVTRRDRFSRTAGLIGFAAWCTLWVTRFLDFPLDILRPLTPSLIYVAVASSVMGFSERPFSRRRALLAIAAVLIIATGIIGLFLEQQWFKSTPGWLFYAPAIGMLLLLIACRPWWTDSKEQPRSNALP